MVLKRETDGDLRDQPVNFVEYLSKSKANMEDGGRRTEDGGLEKQSCRTQI